MDADGVCNSIIDNREPSWKYYHISVHSGIFKFATVEQDIH